MSKGECECVHVHVRSRIWYVMSWGKELDKHNYAILAQ